jgi:hypothetical protein
VVDKIINRIPGWKGKLTSYSARLTLLKARLASILIYLMSVIKFPKWAIKAINSQMSNFFWNDQEGNHKYHLSNWQSLCQRKEAGELGIPDMRELNLCLLASWVQRFYDGTSQLWKHIVDCKYDTLSPNVFCYNGRNLSPFCRGVLWAAKAAKMGFRWKVGNGQRIRFWEDQWFGSCSLAIQFWEIYTIVHEQGISLRDAWDGERLRFSLRRTIDRRFLERWQEIVQIAKSMQFSEEEDAIVWEFSSSGKYSVQSLYANVNNRGDRQIYTPVIWKLKVPSRIHIFCGSLLIKDINS